MTLQKNVLDKIIFLICVLWFWQGQVYSEPLAKIKHHGIFVSGRGGLANLIYNPTKQLYEKRAELAGAHARQIFTLDKYVFATLGNEIVKLDDKFRKIVSKKFSNVGAIATDNKNIFIAADGSFIALNRDFKELSRVKFDFNYYGLIPKGKNVTNILIHKKTAYLIDNIMLPLFLFQVDISNPKNMQITKKIQIDAVNAHLDNQWLNLELNQWLINGSYDVESGAGQNVYIYSMDSAKAITSKVIYTVGRYEYYDVAVDESIVKINANRVFVNISLINPEEVNLTIKIYYEYHDRISTENITLNKVRMVYLAKGFNNPSMPITKVEIYNNGELIHKGKFYREKGFKIRYITNFSPTWAIITDRDEKFFLAQVSSKNNEITFSNQIELDYMTDDRTIIRQKGDYLFIYVDKKLKEIPRIEIFDIKQQANVIKYIDLNNLKLGLITDFCPY